LPASVRQQLFIGEAEMAAAPAYLRELTMIPMTITPEWRALQLHRRELASLHLREAFAADYLRFERCSLEAAGLFLDYSKNLIDDRTLGLLCALARAQEIEARRDEMFAGHPINNTEQRAVLHMALRHRRSEPIPGSDGLDVMPAVRDVLQRMGRLVTAVHSGTWTGFTGQPITDIVNIGIGGSDLGPKMVCAALRPYGHPRLQTHFVSNIDGAALDDALLKLRPETTLFIIASKTFTTQETLANAHSARRWFLDKGGRETDIARHFVAVSTNAARVSAFGIDPRNMFEFWDWVGGRYSLWSAVGLPIALTVGIARFESLLDGAQAMDEHFRSAPLERNLPAILGLLGIWYRNFFGASSHCIAPYAQDLRHLPAYLQQLEMESNGKSVTRSGEPVATATCPVIWGEPGTNGQHAFFQLLHQGTDLIPVDFIAPLQAQHAMPDHQRLLLANCFAQSEALMRGKTAAEAAQELAAAGLPPEAVARLVPHKCFPGNRPSSTLLLPDLSPGSLGALIALYEHKVFVQGAIWDVNSFDQWGVELGKQLASRIAEELGGAASHPHDSSTAGLIARART
jgi:glucose-6-phosphate isomerase